MSTTQTDFLRYLRTLTARQSTGLLSDQQLLERFLHDHSEPSFAALVARHGPMVLSVCRRVLQHAQDAEDAFQATFLVLARKASSIRKQASLGSWLHGVAYHSAECLRVKARRRNAHEHRWSAPPVGDLMDDITWRELRSVLDEELQNLPEKYRAPLVLCYLEARTQDEGARQLGWSKNTFRRRLESGRNALGRRLARRGITLSAALSAPLLADPVANASLPPLLAANTVRAGLSSLLGNTGGDTVSSQVAAVAEGGVGSLLAKKTGIALVLFASLALGLGSLLAYRAVQGRTFAKTPATPLASPSSPAGSERKDQSVEIKGCVLGPDGKPFAGAHVFLASRSSTKKADLPPRVTTESDGRFHLAIKSADFDPQGKATLAVTAKGLGPDWIELKAEGKDNLTLRLVKDDIPIEGRVLDLEGRPVAGVRVRVVGFMQGDVDAWMEGTLRRRYPQLTNRISPEVLGEPNAAVTDKDGRFRLTGLGRDRVMHVLLEGDNIERGDFEVVTRLEVPKGLSRGNNGVYPARFDHLAGPGKSITGVIRDKRTGKPIADISVACPFTPSWIWAKSDAQGHYRLTGVPKHKEYYVAAGGLPYFNCTKHDVVDTPGLAPIVVDFALERGIAVRGKLFDKVTGKPISGRVSYVSLPNNPNLKDFSDLGKPQMLVSDSGRTKADGSFTVVAVPGPGMLAATADDEHHYLRAEVEDPKPVGGLILEQYHAMVHISPAEKGGQSAVRDIALSPARLRKGTVIGQDGKPLAGAHFAGLSGIVQLRFGRNDTMETASFMAGGLDSKGSRNLVFVHAERKLAKVQKVRGAEQGPLAVRLEPLGAINGRILDAKGQPRTKLKVAIMLSVQREDYKDLPLELLYDYPAWSKLLNHEATTDAEGRFRVEGLVPGLKYFLNVKEDGTIIESLTREIAVESGKVRDLGDLKIR
jgi:RNA polymerase sigma factor (sigma-70 family)